MRLMCTVSVLNRAFIGKSNNQKRKPVKSTLALCKQPKSEEHCILLFSAQNKNGTKYAIKSNVARVFTRFVDEGKATIQFIQPEHDVCLQADTIQLKSFLHLLKRVLENKISPKEFTMSSLAVTPINSNNVAPKKLVILKRSDYPLRGFPRTLEVLHINDIRRCGLDRGILQLFKLRILDLSHNLIEFLPEEINKLPNLAELNISHNLFGLSHPRKWDWMDNNLSKSLKSLNLTNNQMKFLPDQLIKLHNLISLHTDKNQLISLPSGIGNLKNLRILTAADNQITALPGSVRKLQLDELDLSGNALNGWQQNHPPSTIPKPLPVSSLKEYAARKVLYSRLMYSRETLPLTVIKYLELAKYCVCGKGCFEHFIQHILMFYLRSIANIMKISSNGTVYVPIECYFCSLQCFNTTINSRLRQPIIR